MSTTSAKTQAQKKVQRQKQFIAVGSVVLLVILGFEMTKVLSHGSHQATPATPSSVPGAAGSPPSTSSSQLPDTDRVVVQRASNQLISFGLFGSKDPFVQQVTTIAAPSVPPAAAAPAPITGKTSPAIATTTAPITPSQPAGAVVTPVTSTTPAPSAPGQAASPTTTSSTPIAPTSALISTNGVCESVAVKGTFPYGADIFRLVSIARDGKSVQIGVVGGSYDSGQASATLKMSEKLTLVNTGDGTRYVIQLRSKCDVVAQPTGATGAPSATTTQPVTPVPPAPTTTTTTTPATTTSPTATTPIVPDSLDPTTTVPTG